MSAVIVCYIIILCGRFAWSTISEVEDDALIYTSITDMAKLLTTANKIHEKTNHLANIYDTRLKYIYDVFVEDLSMLTHENSKASSLDVNVHIKVLFDLQDFYHFDTQDIADGILKESAINVTFSALDCYEIGSWALENQDGYHAKLWLKEAKRRLLLKLDDTAVRMEEILLKLANVYSVYKDAETTNQIVKEILRIDPLNQGALQLQIVMQSASTIYNVFVDKYAVSPTKYDWGGSSNYTFIQQLCHQTKPLQEELSINFCYYLTMYRYYLIKVELLSMEPPLGMIHDVITNKEINAFQQQADLQNKMRLARNHSTIIKARSNKIIKNLIKKIEMLTLPPVYVSDLISHTHFDIGEFHKLRYKPLKAQRSFSNVKEKGFNLMIFLNNVEGGGNVIFPWLNLSIIPQKGKALLWEFPKEKVEKRLLHTVCPIYTGNLTVAQVRGYTYDENQ